MSLIAAISCGLVRMRPVPLRIGLQADIEFGVEEAGCVGAVVGRPCSEATVVTSGKEAMIARTWGTTFADLSKEIV